MSVFEEPRCKSLVLDAGPLLSLSPLRGLAETYFTVPQVLAELKDKRAREHFERLGLNAGVHIEVCAPDAASLAHAIQFAKKTGDYAVLSHTDLCVIALTYALHVKAKREENITQKTVSGDAACTDAIQSTSSNVEGAPLGDDPEDPQLSPVLTSNGCVEGGTTHEVDTVEHEPQDVADDDESDHPQINQKPVRDSESDTESPPQPDPSTPLYDDPSDDDDGEGEWITPSNVSLHKSRALELLPNASGTTKNKPNEVIGSGCMTADFAMQNVLLQMGLNLVGVGGERIERVKSWVLRCHACFKICKDMSKKFCPSCGNATLLRASVTISASTESPGTTMQVHLKKNFQYKTRGTIYPIPAPKPGSAKTGSGEGLILREDQIAYINAKKRNDGKREREEKKMIKGVFANGGKGGVGVGNWMDPDWVPSVMGVAIGSQGKNVRNTSADGDMPVVGYGRRNPNERRRRK